MYVLYLVFKRKLLFMDLLLILKKNPFATDKLKLVYEFYHQL